ncbi:c-type cytochrome [Stieleria sedimenti]|uniref:c-type cytochrome n=1 Tax=Stieleria sedimenti TaxID=2976331 RepID=UPI002B220B27|nr:c-type cytochrome [Stieleria sedimenti]
MELLNGWRSDRRRSDAANPLGPHRTPPLSLDGLTANVQRNAMLSTDRCVDCHGENGQGSDEGPPVWGDKSYKDGAGLSRVAKLASWLKVAMPLDDASLTTQESRDLAAFINSHPRPTFLLSEHLPQDSKLDESRFLRSRLRRRTWKRKRGRLSLAKRRNDH